MQRKKLILSVLLIFLFIFLYSCTIVEFSARDKKLMYDPDIKNYTIVGSFSITITEISLIFKLLVINQPGKELDDILKEQIVKYKGDAIINLKFIYHITAIQYVLMYITGGIFTPSSVTIEGDVIRYR
ncbi:MAG: hypothetical protein ACK4YF_00475 [Exilispira sp.]